MPSRTTTIPPPSSTTVKKHISASVPVPILIQAFPTPPTYIPSSTSPNATNPPPSLPPSLPLPPVPGPSPLSERDTVLFLSSTRASKLSLDSKRDSFASIRSDSSSSRKHHPPSIAFSISEDTIESVLDIPKNNNNNSGSITRKSSTLPPLPFLNHHRTDSRSQTPKRRSPSPDINTILSSTPRPRRSISKSRSTSWSRSSRDPTDKEKYQISSAFLTQSWSHTPGPGPRSTEGERSPSRSRSRSRVRKRPNHLPLDKDKDMDLDEVDPIDPEMEARLERQLDGDGSDSSSDWDGGQSDSSLDLKTPLSHLMLRHGHLSPNSKLLPQNSVDAGTDGLRPISTVSAVSISPSLMTSVSKLRDERDTPKRRRRHRDGGLLRGGIGLTTGLGWSDSEDEDAPSALTRRLSTLDLSRRPSGSSVRSITGGNRLAKSFNGMGHRDRGRHRPKNASIDEFGVTSRSTVTPKAPKVKIDPLQGTSNVKSSSHGQSAPPTSWTKRTPSATATNATSNRASTSSVGSARSSSSLYRGPGRNGGAAFSGTSASSTASSISIVTPLSLEVDAQTVADAGIEGTKGGILSPRFTGVDKGLPPLPEPITTTNGNLKHPATKGRARAYSSSSSSVTATSVSINGRQASRSISSVAVPLLPFPPPGLGTSTSTPTSTPGKSAPSSMPRPLHLPSTSAKTLRLPSILRSSVSAGATVPATGKQPPVATPRLSASLSAPLSPTASYSRHVSDQQRLRAASGPRYSDSALLSPLVGGTLSATVGATMGAKTKTRAFSTSSTGATARSTSTATTVAATAAAAATRSVGKSKPRTGTGMTYRNTASYTELGQTRSRTPVASGNTGAVVGMSTSSSFSSNSGISRKVALVV